MNRMILAGARRGERSAGALAQLSGAPDAEQHRARLQAAMEGLKAAKAEGDDAAIGYAEHVLDKRLAEARAEWSERPRDEQGRFVGAPAPSFDGGPRGPRPRRRPLQPTSNQLMREAMIASRIERAERDADEHTIIGNV